MPHSLPTAAELRVLTYDIHQSNVRAGWWSNLATGESILHTRNRPEVMMLIISEYSEAWLGASDNAMDDHLTHRRMFDVELADAVIREMDLLGAEDAANTLTDEFVQEILANIDEFDILSYDAINNHPVWLLNTMGVISKAMEFYRKSKRQDYLQSIASAVIITFEMARRCHISLLEIIAEKRAYNDQRADHKRENRLIDGGKKL
jgi:hypothetical protein